MDFKNVPKTSIMILLLHYFLNKYKNALDFYEFYSLRKKSSSVINILNLKRINTFDSRYNIWNMLAWAYEYFRLKFDVYTHTPYQLLPLMLSRCSVKITLWKSSYHHPQLVCILPTSRMFSVTAILSLPSCWH